MEIVVIVAMDQRGAIGKDGGIPWHLPADLKRFRALTLGHCCIMGRKTYDSLPVRPLSGRRTLVISRTPGPDRCGSLAEALAVAQQEGHPTVFICGGKSVYEEAFPLADRVELTRVETTTDADVFVEFDPSRWTETNREQHEGYSFQTLIPLTPRY